MTALEKKLDELERLANAAHNSVAGDYSHAWQNFYFATQPINLLALIQDIRSLIKSSPVAAGGGWRPIETAPKDGTVIDLWNGSRIPNCYWGSSKNDDPENYGPGAKWEHLGLEGWKRGKQDAGSIMSEGQFTHWQPLPTPPEDK